MSIKNLIERDILEKCDYSQTEIDDLLRIVERDLKDSATVGVSYDWQFGISYNAALKLATILVRASGYRIKGQGHHMNTIAMIPLILGKDKKNDSDYLDACRRKRNTVEYDYVNGATASDVKELREFIIEFKDVVLKWLSKKK